MSRHLSRVLLAIALLTALLAVNGLLVAQEENVLVIGHAESTDSLDPARGYTQTTGIIAKAIYETLVTFPDDSAAEILRCSLLSGRFPKTA